MLLPRVFKIIGWVLFLIGSLLSGLVQFTNYAVPWLNYGGRTQGTVSFPNTVDNFTDETGATALILGLMFIAFARLKKENDNTRKLRLHSLYWATVVVCGLTATVLCLTYFISLMPQGVEQLVPNSLLFYLFQLNFASVLFAFVARFYYLLLKKADVTNLYQLRYKPFNIIGKAGILLYCLAALIAHIFHIGNSVFSEGSFLILPLIALLIGSKEKKEADDAIRLRAILFAVFINAVLVIIVTWTVYGLQYWDVLDYLLMSLQAIFLFIFYLMRFFAARSAIRVTPMQPA